MAFFTLDTSRLGTVVLATTGTGEAFVGQFREIEIHLSQATAGGDALPRFLEVHLTISGPSAEGY